MFLHTMSHNVISDYKPTKKVAIQKHRISKMYIPDLKYIEQPTAVPISSVSGRSPARNLRYDMN